MFVLSDPFDQFSRAEDFLIARKFDLAIIFNFLCYKFFEWVRTFLFTASCNLGWITS